MKPSRPHWCARATAKSDPVAVADLVIARVAVPVVRVVRAALATTGRRAKIVAIVLHGMVRVRSATVPQGMRPARWGDRPPRTFSDRAPRDAAPRTGGDSSETKS